MLVVKDIDVYYGAIHALKKVSINVEQGSIVTLIGANGAGKSTTLKTISGLIRPKSGSITFKGKEITRVLPEKIVELGISQVPEGRRIFAAMTVMENLEMGAFRRKNKADINRDIEMVFTRFPRLKERRKQTAGTLSGGEQQMLAIGRALMARPELLLMDEPSMGLAPLLVREIFEIIKDINSQGTTILLVEQNAKIALSTADYAYVIETGEIVLQGKARELMHSEEVKKAYLGG
ncbi:MAG TPA: ABC transporter ATP-binding protein [Bacillota bacterium]|jgi:branched-chain amino acid transport system ATP-binding protein|nr:ABC transporter ATP-binding protein [Peptococcaceae bacterium MAG4]NLW37733.1 ABC transporter ATP-binding protein [Peptococcaceae bacterium]HPZ43202.1 ABC transporter ATP-binding protein [Bacillota bacterium]HQD76052.1 ABC transporter ATP-binding protein [Bacillota bacterium]HUM58450.1 ABC transporter ATP-binding protein [Bacillota bacterium]